MRKIIFLILTVFMVQLLFLACSQQEKITGDYRQNIPSMDYQLTSPDQLTVSFNGYNMDLPALSYVEAVYGEYMMLFNYATKETFMELSDGTGTAQPASGDYVISLLGDSMTLNNGNKILLANRPELFDPVV